MRYPKLRRLFILTCVLFMIPLISLILPTYYVISWAFSNISTMDAIINIAILVGLYRIAVWVLDTTVREQEIRQG